jgi:hypothetical protein
MALDPRLSLAGQQARAAPAIGIFQNVLNQRRDMELDPLRKDLLTSQVGQAQLGQQRSELLNTQLDNLIKTEQDAVDLNSIAQFTMQNQPLLKLAQQGNVEPLKLALQTRSESLKRRGRSSNQTDEALAEMQAGNAENVVNSLSMTPQLAGMLKQKQERVTSSEILGDGTTIQSLSTGGTKVISPSGEVLEGEDRVDAIKLARESEVNRRKAIKEAEVGASTSGAGKTKALQTAVTKGAEAFDRIEKINTAIANYDEVIRLIDEGAETGVISSKLPSVKSASVELDNLQGKLGLDVIGNTTFGALSESELQFALDTALPKKLEGPQLKRWVQAKQQSQAKLKDYLTEAASFLSSGENTIADFLQMKKAESVLGGGEMPTTNPVSQMEQPKQSQSTVIRFDAQGNMINGN